VTAACVHVPVPPEMLHDQELVPPPAFTPEMDVKVPLLAVSETVIGPLVWGPPLVTVRV
jgi:hypothetical protein